jgi:C-terminal processing protease CtpA/Prc
MPAQIAPRIALAFMLLLVCAQISLAAGLGFEVSVEGEGFFLNPVVKKLLVSEVTRGSIAEAAGMKSGDEIMRVDGQSIAGKRMLELRPLMKLNPGETRTLRLKHTDGTEVDARITKPKT